MAISNYASLKTEIANHLHRGDLNDDIPGFITRAENILNDQLRIKSMITTSTITPSVSATTLAFPTGYLEPISMVDDLGDQVQQLHHEELVERQYNNAAGRPRYYSETDTFNFECIADSTYDFKLTYYKKLDIESDDTNDVLTNYEGLYLYGALAMASPFIQDDNRIGVWATFYDAELSRANRRADRSLKKLRTEHPSRARRFDITRGY